jgi:hypothetical protein
VTAASTADGEIASYVADWALDASKDFSIKVDYRFDTNDAGQGWVWIGLTPTPDNPTGQCIDLRAGNVDRQPQYAGRQATTWGRQTWWAARGSDAGTLYISYDAEKDELYRSFTGFGPVNAWQVAEGLMKEQWGAKPLYVTIGGSSTGMALNGGQDWLDNFSVDSGTVIP